MCFMQMDHQASLPSEVAVYFGTFAHGARRGETPSTTTVHIRAEQRAAGWVMESPVRVLLVSGPRFGGNAIPEGMVNIPRSLSFRRRFPNLSRASPSVPVSWRRGWTTGVTGPQGTGRACPQGACSCPQVISNLAMVIHTTHF